MVDRNVRIGVTLDPKNWGATLARMSAQARAFANDLDSGSRAFVKNLDTSNDRVAMLVQSGLALGPALIPTLAAAAPLVAGLGAGMAAAASGIGVLTMALAGMGDALDAIDQYQLDPTAENLAKVRIELEKMSPAGVEFAMFLDDLEPKLHQLKMLAQEGLLPGMEDGIDAMLERLPVLKRMISEVSTVTGRLFREGGEALAGDPFWVEFTDFIAAEAGPTLETYGRIFGNFARMFAGGIMAMDPLADDFNDSLLEFSQNAADWGEGLSDNEGFQDFVGFIRETGPQVANTIAEIVGALISLAKAAAPVGTVSLHVIEGIADFLSLIANSPAGPILIGAAAGIAAVSRAVAMLKMINASAMVDLLKIANQGGAIGLGWKTAAAGIGVFALAVTDLDDSLNIANTATLGLLGSVAGRWGGVLGAAAGATMDASAANDEFADSYDRVQAAAEDLDIAGISDGFNQLTQDVDDFQQLLSEGGDWGDLFNGDALKSVLPSLKNDIEGIFGDSDIEEMQDQWRAARDELASMATGLNEFRHALSGSNAPMAGYTNDLGKLQETADTVVPALEAIGYSSDQIRSILTTGVGLDQAIAEVRDYNAAQDSISGRTEAVSEAISGLDDELLSTAASADTLSAALEGLFTPQMNLSEATDAWHQALADLRGEINRTNPTLQGQSNAARQNREAVRGLATSLIEVMNAQAGAGRGAAVIARTLSEGRAKILAFADAAGLGRRQTAAFLRELGLTPKLVRTVIDTNISQKRQEAMAFREEINKLPREFITRLATPGAVESRADVAALARELKLTPKQTKVAMDLIDNASGGLQEVLSLLNEVDGRTAVSTTVHYVKTIQQFYAENPGGRNADGNVYRRGRPMAFANGTERHVPMIGRPGDIRIWNEPEADGESYIPHAYSKRSRALRIWAETGHILGVSGFAEGDVDGKGKSISDKSVREILAKLRDQFGRNSPIISAIQQWLEGLKQGELTDKALMKRIDKAVEHQISPALRGFKVGGGQDVSETRSELRELMRVLKETLGPDSPVVARVEKLGKRLLEVQAKQDRTVARYDRANDKLDRITERQGQFMADVRQAFTHDAFAGEDINTVGDSRTQLMADANDAQATLRQFRRLSKKGLDDSLIKQLALSGNYSLIRQLSGQTPAQIAAYERAFKRRNSALGALSQFTGQKVFGDEIKSQTQVVRGLRREVRHLNRVLNQLEHRVERGAEKGFRRAMSDHDRRQQRRRRSKAVR